MLNVFNRIARLYSQVDRFKGPITVADDLINQGGCKQNIAVLRSQPHRLADKRFCLFLSAKMRVVESDSAQHLGAVRIDAELIHGSLQSFLVSRRRFGSPRRNLTIAVS